MMTTGDRVKAKRKELGLSQTALGALAGLTQPTISALERNESHTSGSLASIARALHVNALWLETGLGQPDLLDASGSAAPESDTITIPLLECKGSCGNGRLYGDIDYSPVSISRTLLRKYHTSHTSPNSLIALYADGDSMSPFIVHGDIMFFDTSISDFRDGGIYLIDTPDGLRVKRVNRRADGRVILRSDSPDKVRFPDEEYTQEQAPHLAVKGRFVFRIGG